MAASSRGEGSWTCHVSPVRGDCCSLECIVGMSLHVMERAAAGAAAGAAIGLASLWGDLLRWGGGLAEFDLLVRQCLAQLP